MNPKRLTFSVVLVGFLCGLVLFISGANFTVLGVSSFPGTYLIGFWAQRDAVDYFIATPKKIDLSHRRSDNSIDSSFDLISYLKQHDLMDYGDSFVGVFNEKLAEELRVDAESNLHDRAVLRGIRIGNSQGYSANDIARAQGRVGYTWFYLFQYAECVLAAAIWGITFGIVTIFAVYSVRLAGLAFGRWITWVKGS